MLLFYLYVGWIIYLSNVVIITTFQQHLFYYEIAMYEFIDFNQKLAYTLYFFSWGPVLNINELTLNNEHCPKSI